MLSLVETFFLNPLQDLLSSLNAVISTNERGEFVLTGHVIYNPAYTYKFLLKNTYVIAELDRRSKSTAVAEDVRPIPTATVTEF